VTAPIILISLWLFVYWFRYSCLLILVARLQERLEENHNQRSGYRFPSVLNRLAAKEFDGAALKRMRAELEADFEILEQKRRAAETTGDPLLRHMLLLDYKLLSVWFRLMRRCSPCRAGQALVEMSRILEHLAEAS